MLILRILSLLFFAVVLPLGMGAGAAAFVDRQERNIGFMWMAGQLTAMALFQAVAVPVILLQEKLGFLYGGGFSLVVWIFGCASGAAAVAGGAVWLKKRGRRTALRIVEKPKKTTVCLWTAVGALLLLQLFLAVYLSFPDGDDAYYVAVSTITEASDRMYLLHPYVGETTKLDIRHGLAPFPVWIAFLARVSGIHPAIVSKIAMPLLLIPLTYVIYGMTGSRFLKGRREGLAVFMLFIELLVMWGNYSIYTAETFLMTRTRQGKAALGNLVIPAMIFLFCLIGERMAENKKTEKGLWTLLFAAVTAAGLCSTLGSVLVILLLGMFCLCAAAVYKRWKLLLPAAVCILPGLANTGLYLLLR